MSCAELFSSITDLPVWSQPHHVRIVWVTLRSMVKRSGIAFATLPSLAHRARVTLPEAEDAIRVLCAPDADGQHLKHEGRQLMEVEGGWLLLDHDLHREILGVVKARESRRDWYHRNKSKPANDSGASGG